MDDQEIPEWLKYQPEPEEQKQERLRIYEEKHLVLILALSRMIDTYLESGQN
jgi:hypothetical protein